jgi:hypothetical protein
MPAVAIFLGTVLGVSVLPQVEDPWPERIGIDFIFTAAGAIGALAGIYHARSPALVREQAVNRGGRIGFFLGLGTYLLALVAQLVSKL